VRYAVGAREMPTRPNRIEPGKGLGGHALLTGRPYRTDDYPNDPSFGKEYAERARTNGTITALVVPIKSADRTIGLIYVANREARQRGETVPSQYESEAVRRDGSLVWLDIQVSEILWENEPAIQSTVLDITERTRAEEALRQSEAQLRQAQKMEAVGRLAGGVAHDFNNLLTVITGRTQLLLAQIGADAASRRELELIEQTADRAGSLTKQLLTFSRKQ